VEAGGFGYREWINTVPASGEDWPERDEFSAYSDRAFAEELRPVRQLGALQPDEIVLICVVRNEALRLPLFFTHYRKLGVTRFMVIDNDSTDDTPALLLAEPTAYRSSSDVSVAVIPRMAHMHNFASTRELLWARIAAFAESVPLTTA